MKKQFSGFLGVMPFIPNGKSEWDWLGVGLASALHDKLLMCGLSVLPFFELNQLDPAPEPELLASWESYIQLADFLDGGYILTGSYLFEEKRVKIDTYVVQGSGFYLLAQVDDTKEDFVQLLDRICQEIAVVFGKPPNARMRERIHSCTSTASREALEASKLAIKARLNGSLSGVRELVQQAQELDPEYLEPLDVLSRATLSLGSPEAFETALRAELTQLVASPTYFKSAALIDEWLSLMQYAGNTKMVAECQKARGAIQGNGEKESIAVAYARRAQEQSDIMAAMLEPDEADELSALRQASWSIGQIVALTLMARSWLGQAEVARRTGLHAVARFNASRTAKLWQLLGNYERRQEALDLAKAASAAIPA